MFFKPRAQKLIEALDSTCNGPNVSPKDFLKYKELDEKIQEWGAVHPEEFIPTLSDDKADLIGLWIRGSGDKGISLLRDLIRVPDAPQRRAALRALWEFEEDAASEIPLLTELLDDPDPRIRQSAAHCLGRIGPPAVSAGAKLAYLAQYGDEDQRRSALFALERTGYDPMITAQICYDAVHSGPESLQHYALSTIREIEADPTPVLDVILRELVECDNNPPESDAIELLSKVNLSEETLHRRVIHALQTFIQKQPPDRTKALSVLWEIDPGNATIFAQVEDDLQSDDSQMERACDVICHMKEAGARFVPLLIQQLEKHWEYWDFCWSAVDALGEIGSAAKTATTILERLKAHPSALVQERAGIALEKIMS